MIVNAIKSDINLSNLYNQFLDELKILINHRKEVSQTSSERDDIILHALASNHDLSDMNIQCFLGNQINNTLSNLDHKEDLLLKVLKRNKDLYSLDLSPF